MPQWESFCHYEPQHYYNLLGELWTPHFFIKFASFLFVCILSLICVADSNSHKKLGNNTESFGTRTNNTTTHTKTKNNISSFRTRINNIQRKKTGSNINIGRAYTTGVDESEEQSLKVLYLYY
jgi:hypothetical protein